MSADTGGETTPRRITLREHPLYPGAPGYTPRSGTGQASDFDTETFRREPGPLTKLQDPAEGPRLPDSPTDEADGQPVDKRVSARLLVPVDGSELSAAALPVAEWIGRGLKAEIVLVMVGPIPETSEQAADEQRGLTWTLDRAAQRLSGLPVRKRPAISNSPTRGILDAIVEERPDLIVMSTHGRSGWSELVQGSVAEEVVRAGLAPVTLVRPPNP
jgi:nucleotide-binding universal stress UspA family protein